MAEAKSPQSINAEESDDMKTAIVKLVIPDLTVEKKLFGSTKPKPGESEVNVKFDALSIEVDASVTKRGQTTKYFYKANKLPGEIDPDKSSVAYKKELVILTLVKKEESTWAVMLSQNGLDQAPDE